MLKIVLKLTTTLFLILLLGYHKACSQDSIRNNSGHFFIAASGSFSASKNIDIARYYLTRSIGGEVGFFIGNNKNIFSITYEKTQINEYDAKYKNLHFLNLNIKRLISLSDKLHLTTAISAGRAKGKFINFGINPQGGSEINGVSKHTFLDLGARYKPSLKVFVELRFLQIGYVDKYIDKQFPSGLKAWVINDDEYFPLRLSVGYQF